MIRHFTITKKGKCMRQLGPSIYPQPFFDNFFLFFSIWTTIFFSYSLQVISTANRMIVCATQGSDTYDDLHGSCRICTTEMTYTWSSYSGWYYIYESISYTNCPLDGKLLWQLVNWESTNVFLLAVRGKQHLSKELGARLKAHTLFLWRVEYFPVSQSHHQTLLHMLYDCCNILWYWYIMCNVIIARHLLI